MRSRAVILLALVALAGCSRDAWQRAPGPDDVVALVPWFANMNETISIKPYEMPRDPVEGTVPITGTEPPLEIASITLPAINRIENPVNSTSESIERGRDRFDIYCALCHGDGGAGDGLVNEALFNIAPSLLTEQARAYSDGYLYTIIRHGRGIMPAYGDKIMGNDRWHVVNYVRVLQGAAQ